MRIDLYNKNLEGVLDIEQYCKDNNIDAKEVIHLDCYKNNLTEIKGLDKLVNLERLYCGHNKLTEIQGIDKLANLKSLHCTNNQLTEIKGLHKLVNLELLFCHNNKLKELDVSNLVNLQWLNDEIYKKC